eukprot:TRINITY_DN2639_c1_g1_i1.p1 TRINITY_DN2639_c1_g1~~TRINITY_DN2639_c1_g1_i1.p1  ORF type:complete len:415 (+),score=54.38 TRINITY_DN2639_c1_g1_i1:270-1514(+)
MDVSEVFTKTRNVIRERRPFNRRRTTRGEVQKNITGTVRAVSTCDEFDLGQVASYFKQFPGVTVMELVDVVGITIVGESGFDPTGVAPPEVPIETAATRIGLFDEINHSDAGTEFYSTWCCETSTNSATPVATPLQQPPTTRTVRLESDTLCNVHNISDSNNRFENKDNIYHVFFFTYGVVVWWSSNPPTQDWIYGGRNLLRRLDLMRHIFETGSKEILEPETCQWMVGVGEPNAEERDCKIDCDVFKFTSIDDDARLACSYGLAQSTQLHDFEVRVAEVVNETKDYPIMLLEGEVVSHNTLCKKRGELFLHCLDINLHTDILDTPDFFWKRTDLEPLYHKARKYMEISDRVDVLNRRLSVVQEMMQVLNEEIQTRTENRLEWYIIWLLFLDFIATFAEVIIDFLKRGNRKKTS